ncbi:transposase, partial [Novipirellula galeiformis]|uniref:transposase n=1 Tax=Novipirellula galeiformis TaxID=2528004 RepID=UPI001E509BA0
MARLTRSEVFDPGEIAIAHICSRTVRRCFLMGNDPFTGKNFDHRKEWIEQYLTHFANCFGVDLLAFALLSNHVHLILRTRPDVVATWSDNEVARRWMMICPHRRGPDGQPLPPTEAEIRSIAGCPVKCDEIRKRLSSISWWMRLLCQRVAMRANHEDEESGHFFQDRFHATRIVDEASLLACAAYVDLNPIRAAMAKTLEQSDHTSVQRRIESITSDRDEVVPAAKRRDRFLAPVSIDERSDEIGPCVSRSGKRCSDKGFLPMSLEDYLETLDWTARQIAPGKYGRTPADVPPVLRRLGLDTKTWCELVGDFGRLFCLVAGRPESVDPLR